MLTALGLELATFKAVVGGDQVSNIKPDIEPFVTIAEAIQKAPKFCVSIGDRENIDLVPAKKMGMKTVLVSKGVSKSPFVDITIGSLGKIEEALSGLLSGHA